MTFVLAKIFALARFWPKWSFMVIGGGRLDVIRELENIDIELQEKLLKNEINDLEFTDILDDSSLEQSGLGAHDEDIGDWKMDEISNLADRLFELKILIAVLVFSFPFVYLCIKYIPYASNVFAAGFLAVCVVIVGMFSVRVIGGTLGNDESNTKPQPKYAWLSDLFGYCCFGVSIVPFTAPWVLAYFFPLEFLLFAIVFACISSFFSYMLKYCYESCVLSSIAPTVVSKKKNTPLTRKRTITMNLENAKSYLRSEGGREWCAAFIFIEFFIVFVAAFFSEVWETLLMYGDAAAPTSSMVIISLALVSTALFLQSFWITYAAGGQWLNFDKGWSFFQPFEGGKLYVILQGMAWCSYAVMLSRLGARLHPYVLRAMADASYWNVNFSSSAIDRADRVMLAVASLSNLINLPTRSIGLLQVLSFFVLVLSLSLYKPAKASRSRFLEHRMSSKTFSAMVPAHKDDEHSNAATCFLYDVLRTCFLSLVLFVAVKPDVILFVWSRIVVSLWNVEYTGVPVTLIITSMLLLYVPSYFGRPSVTGARFANFHGGDSLIMSALEHYFRFSLARSTMEAWDPKAKYIFGFHAHGLIPPAATYCKNTSHWAQLFPGIRPVTLSATITHHIPVLRDLIQLAGGLEVSKRGFWNGLRKFGSVILVPGGQHEMILAQEASPHEEPISAKHSGFIRLAFRHAKEFPEEETFVVPMFGFQERTTIKNIPGIPIGLQKWFVKNFRSNIGFFPIGRFNLPSVPKPANVTLVVGKPIRVPIIQGTTSKNPTQEQVQLLHQHYCYQLKKMYDLFKKDAAEDPSMEMKFFPEIDLVNDDEFITRWAKISDQSAPLDEHAEEKFQRDIDPNRSEFAWQETIVLLVLILCCVYIPHYFLDF